MNVFLSQNFLENWGLPFAVLVAVLAYTILAAFFYNMDV